MSSESREVRRAEVGDLERLTGLRRAMDYPGSILHDRDSYYSTALRRLEEYLPHAEDFPDWRVYLVEEAGEPVAYVLLVVDQEHGVTHQLQARILDFAVFRFETLSALVERTRRIVTAFENEYVVVELPATDRRMQLWFYRCGFRPEHQRSVKTIRRGHVGETSPIYKIRAARSDDLPTILEVHSAFTRAYLPGGRDMALEELEFHFQMTYLGLDLEGTDGSVYLVMEEAPSGRFAGYVFLKPGLVFSGTPSYYLYDIAVAPAFAGRGLSRYLVGAAETVVGERGGFLYGDGSLKTPVIANWHARMGAVHDSTLFALDCRAEHVNNM